MKGHVDQYGRALLPIELRSAAGGMTQSAEGWIDTEFTGELYLPQATIDQLQLSKNAMVRAEMADGSQVDLI